MQEKENQESDWIHINKNLKNGKKNLKQKTIYLCSNSTPKQPCQETKGPKTNPTLWNLWSSFLRHL
jgi:hypothetical protein